MMNHKASSMGRKGLVVHGWLVIDKPSGVTSAGAVARVKRTLNAQKAGHSGTLDPLAEGVLPIALGEATKTVAWVMRGAKIYRFTVAWGEERTTDDREGAVVRTSAARPSEEAIVDALPRFIGPIAQVPPAYSAVKVAGKRAYKLAREGAPPALEARLVMIDDFVLLRRPDENTSEFEVICGKGTYVRALARDLARALGTCGHIAWLRRTRVGPFDESQAISLDNLTSLGHSARRGDPLLPVEAALADIPALPLTGQQAARLRHGGVVKVADTPQGEVRAMAAGKLVALADVSDGEARARRVFNL
jgi:tRNA pseudouridine55 synthase